MYKKLYRVKVVLYVMAENESDACLAATQAQFDIFECTARKAEYVEPDWVEAIPYNSDDYRTCAEVFASQKVIVRPAASLPATPVRGEPRVRMPVNAISAQVSPG